MRIIAIIAAVFSLARRPLSPKPTSRTTLGFRTPGWRHYREEAHQQRRVHELNRSRDEARSTGRRVFARRGQGGTAFL